MWAKCQTVLFAGGLRIAYFSGTMIAFGRVGIRSGVSSSNACALSPDTISCRSFLWTTAEFPNASDVDRH